MTAQLSETDAAAAEIAAGVPAAPAAAAAPKVRAGGGHLHYIDIVRVLTVALVIAVHMTGQQTITPTLTAGAVLTVAHVSREVFFLLTAFVLTYSYRDRPVRPLSFWRKRFLFVAVPYVAWSVIYFLADNSRLDPVSSAIVTLLHDLSNGAARYHLYFLLVSMQIYLVFPLLRAMLKATRRWHTLLLVVCAAYQLTFYLAVQQNWTLGPLTGWLRLPDAWLSSYLGFVIAGGIAAWHAEGLVAWVRSHLSYVFAGSAATIGVGIAVFLGQALIGGQNPLIASNVFQPVVVVESVGVAMAFLALGLVWQDCGRPAKRWVRNGADASFGIYLAHPLLIQGLLWGASLSGLTTLAQHAPPDLVLLIELVVIVPLLYVLAGTIATLARHTPFSLAIAGRARLRARKAPATVEHTPLPFTNRPLPTQGGTR
ncbi:MAG TPA: acyltransferase [Pseudonocardiaceae bacterium]|jgi:peptidoglycan/LPS O-acetylase OafA/YrhL|nr:acyltransferase [Pseudonocardiaceae bacterium]